MPTATPDGERGDGAAGVASRNEIAVVVPVYMGKEFLQELSDRLIATLAGITPNFSIVLVDDRSADNAWPAICELGRKDRRIRGLQLSRNFGQHYALTAGLDHADASWYVVMDCDLQDAPEDIPLLYAKAKQGFDVVVGARRKEGHGWIKRHASKVFYQSFNWLAGFNIDWSVGNFRIFSDRVAVGFRGMREQMRFFPASLSFMGFDVAAIELPHHARAAGKSSYTARKLAALAFSAILAHSQKPLKIATYFGLTISVASIVAAVAIMIRAWVWGIPVPGWASLTVAVCVVGGVQIFVTGVVGIYVGRTFEEAKKRPLYFVKDYSNVRL